MYYVFLLILPITIYSMESNEPVNTRPVISMVEHINKETYIRRTEQFKKDWQRFNALAKAHYFLVDYGTCNDEITNMLASTEKVMDNMMPDPNAIEESRHHHDEENWTFYQSLLHKALKEPENYAAIYLRKKNAQLSPKHDYLSEIESEKLKNIDNEIANNKK